MKCTKCGKELAEPCFYLDYRKGKRVQPCIPCKRLMTLAVHHRNKEKRRSKAG